jgi:hypothetical protein
MPLLSRRHGSLASLNLLTNKWVLYIILILGVFDIFSFYQNGHTLSLYVFFIVGVLTSFFSKNMIVIIVSAIAISHIFTYGERMSEGFEEEEKEKEEEAEEEENEGFDEEEEKYEEQKEEGKKKEIVPTSADIKTAAADLSNELKKTGVAGLNKDTSDLIMAQKTLLENLSNLEKFSKIEGFDKKEGLSKNTRQGFCNLSEAYSK